VIPLRTPAFLIGLTAAQFIVQAALDAKRLHDIGRSALLVVWTSVLGVVATIGVVLQWPAVSASLTEYVADSIGPLAKTPLVGAVVGGLLLAAALRSSWLWAPKSKAAGDIYDYNPLAARLEAAGQVGKSSLDADALIAKALEDQRLKDAAAAMRQAIAEGRPPAQPMHGPRKSFGRRSA
jgi:hypothetical protein